MKGDILDIANAIIVLKEGLVVIDFSFNRYKLDNDMIIIKGENSRYKLSMKDFIELYKEKKFIILDDESCEIDFIKDEEYYSFKHK